MHRTRRSFVLDSERVEKIFLCGEAEERWRALFDHITWCARCDSLIREADQGLRGISDSLSDRLREHLRAEVEVNY